MYTYKDISEMINDCMPCKNVYFCPFGCPHISDMDNFEFECIHICDLLNIADYQIYWGEF